MPPPGCSSSGMRAMSRLSRCLLRRSTSAPRSKPSSAPKARPAQSRFATDDVAGYVLGTPKDVKVWGPNVWVDYAGHAAEEPELVRDLYAVAAARWHEDGRNRQYVLVPATDRELVDAWFRLSFGAQHAAGIQETPESTNDAPQGVVVRRAIAEDVEAVVRLDLDASPPPGALAPVFAPGPTYTEEESRDEFLKEVDDAGAGDSSSPRSTGESSRCSSWSRSRRRAMHTGLARSSTPRSSASRRRSRRPEAPAPGSR